MNKEESREEQSKPVIAVVIPCYAVRSRILSVLKRIGPGVDYIYVVDDKCPEDSGTLVLDECSDERIQVLFHDVNQGVGAAMRSGYKKALIDGAEIIVKIDGDGQTDPAIIDAFVGPILDGQADYTKGNRFFNPEDLKGMPRNRLLGNAVLSFMTKLSTGYWNIFDPTNGYTAIHAAVLERLPLERIDSRYFFESDMLFRLNTLRAVVMDVPMKAIYGEEKSHLKITKIIGEFIWKHCKNFMKRVFYNYYLRDFGIASVELICGIGLFSFGFSVGVIGWYKSIVYQKLATSGTVMLAALPIIIGLQLLLSFLSYDYFSTPAGGAVHQRLTRLREI